MEEPFRTTRWSVVARADAGGEAARVALGELVSAYWRPLYVFARRQGRSPEDSEDLVQGFFARAAEKGGLKPREQRSRFRGFLIAAFRHFAANEHARATAAKRGGGAASVTLDGLAELEAELAGRSPSPEAEYDRRYAVEILARALGALRAEQERAGKAAWFAELEPHLTGVDVDAPQAELAAALGTTPGALKVALHRLRKRFGEILRAEVAETVQDPREVDLELSALRDALRGGA